MRRLPGGGDGPPAEEAGGACVLTTRPFSPAPVPGLATPALPRSQESPEIPAGDQTCRVGSGEPVRPVPRGSRGRGPHVVACSGSVPLEGMHGQRMGPSVARRGHAGKWAFPSIQGSRSRSALICLRKWPTPQLVTPRADQRNFFLISFVAQWLPSHLPRLFLPPWLWPGRAGWAAWFPGRSACPRFLIAGQTRGLAFFCF